MRKPTNSNHHHRKNNLHSIIVLTAVLPLIAISSVSQAKNSARDIKSASVVQTTKTTKVGYKNLGRRSMPKTYLGRAPYICSPSGFGRTSSCKLRVSYN